MRNTWWWGKEKKVKSVTLRKVHGSFEYTPLSFCIRRPEKDPAASVEHKVLQEEAARTGLHHLRQQGLSCRAHSHLHALKTSVSIAPQNIAASVTGQTQICV